MQRCCPGGGSSPARTKDIGAMKSVHRPARFPTEQIARNAPIATSNQFTLSGLSRHHWLHIRLVLEPSFKQRGEQAGLTPPLDGIHHVFLSCSVSACMLMSRSRPERRRHQQRSVGSGDPIDVAHSACRSVRVLWLLLIECFQHRASDRLVLVLRRGEWTWSKACRMRCKEINFRSTSAIFASVCCLTSSQDVCPINAQHQQFGNLLSEKPSCCARLIKWIRLTNLLRILTIARGTARRFFQQALAFIETKPFPRRPRLCGLLVQSRGSPSLFLL